MSRGAGLELSASAIIEHLERLLANNGMRGALAFDADGTLWSGDVGEEAFSHALARDAILEDARPALEREVQSFAPDARGAPTLMAAELFKAYRAGRFPELSACELMVWCYAGWTPAELRRHVREALGLRTSRVRPYRPLLEVATWARKRGLRCIVVSASPQMVVEEAAAPLGFNAEDIVGGEATLSDGQFQPTLLGPIPYAAEKARRGRELIGDLPWLASFGDSAFDLELLKEARLPVAVRPKPALIALLEQVPGAAVFHDA